MWLHYPWHHAPDTHQTCRACQRAIEDVPFQGAQSEAPGHDHRTGHVGPLLGADQLREGGQLRRRAVQRGPRVQEHRLLARRRLVPHRAARRLGRGLVVLAALLAGLLAEARGGVHPPSNLQQMWLVPLWQLVRRHNAAMLAVYRKAARILTTTALGVPTCKVSQTEHRVLVNPCEVRLHMAALADIPGPPSPRRRPSGDGS